MSEDLCPYLDELNKELEEAQDLHHRMGQQGYTSWALGPLCTRDHADRLENLQEAVKAFLKEQPEPSQTMPSYRKAKQTLHSALNAKP